MEQMHVDVKFSWTDHSHWLTKNRKVNEEGEIDSEHVFRVYPLSNDFCPFRCTFKGIE